MGRFEDQKVLVVERFDRKLARDGKSIIRLPQEDFCRATGISPRYKYQADGGAGIAEIMSILARSTQAAADREHFFKTQIFFWLLAALDRAGRQVGLDEVVVARIIGELLDASEGVLEAAASALPEDYPMDVAEAIFQGVRAQSRLLAAQGLP